MKRPISWIVMSGIVLIVIGVLVELNWRKNPKYTNYDNAGPGIWIATPGILLLASRVRFGNKK